jgi:hypothetical protein
MNKTFASSRVAWPSVSDRPAIAVSNEQLERIPKFPEQSHHGEVAERLKAAVC